MIAKYNFIYNFILFALAFIMYLLLILMIVGPASTAGRLTFVASLALAFNVFAFNSY